METQYSYTCPNCSSECSVAESLVGRTVCCPTCSKEFFATPPAPGRLVDSPEQMPLKFVMPERIPFTKAGRRKLLEDRYDSLLATRGSIDEPAREDLNKLALVLGFDAEEAVKLSRERAQVELTPINDRMWSSFVMTDEDLKQIKQIAKKHGREVALDNDGTLCRSTFLLETQKKLPYPISTPLMLNDDEMAYYSVETTWLQPRVHTHGYTGASFSVPTGIEGFSFDFGSYTPIRTEEITPLSEGTLYLTSRRVLFTGFSRNTTIWLKNIIDGHVYSDCVRIESSEGAPDYFLMPGLRARFILSLISVLKLLVGKSRGPTL